MPDPIFRYPAIDPSFFIQNRKKLAAKLLPNSLAILQANDIMPKDADGVMPFCQNSDLFYLCGIDQEETILVLYPDAKEKCHQELLFVKRTSPEIALWEGAKYTQAGARQCAGIAEVHWLEAFPALLHKLMGEVDFVYLNTNEHARAVVEVPTRDARFIQWCQAHYPLHQYKRLAPIMRELRMVKDPIEIQLIREACQITEKGFRAMLPLVKPGVMEYELEAALIGTFVRNRSRGFAFDPIIATGKNACVLHYIANSQVCRAGETILLDVGAEYAGYRADMTRVVPVSGRFTQRQKQVYNAVLTVLQSAKKLLTPGNDWLTYHQQVGVLMQEQLVALGLLSMAEIKRQDPQKPAYKKYFMHGASHHLGLATHDVGNIYSPFVPGMVFTIEPGIYIPEEELGIRLENNVVIRAQGVADLMETIPLHAEEIEELIQAGS